MQKCNKSSIKYNFVPCLKQNCFLIEFAPQEELDQNFRFNKSEATNNLLHNNIIRHV